MDVFPRRLKRQKGSSPETHRIKKTREASTMTLEQIKENITQLHNELPAGVKLVAVSKFHPIEALQAAYDAGQRIFGESRAQEIGPKHTACHKMWNGTS